MTNVGQGYGRAVALAYGRAGYDVVCADRDVDLAAKTAAELELLGGQAIPIQADMTTQMDVLSAYQKVMEIFGALGGVVHLPGQVSTTPFEDLSEGEYYEVMAENVRSTFLALKVAARLLNSGWMVVVAPPAVDSVQMLSVQGALKQMVEGFRQRFAYPRVNLVLPSRPPSDPRHDQALVRAVRFLGSPESAGVSGQVMDVNLPSPPRVTEALLPEVRAALDPNVRQLEEDSELEEWFFEDEPDDLSAGSDYVHEWDHASDEATEPGPWDAAPRSEAGGAVEEPHLSSAHAHFEPDPHGDWAFDLGLPKGPTLRHLVGGDDPLDEDRYASGHEPALDLYGDLSSLAVRDDEEEGAIPMPTAPRRR